ncbi:MAG TPA: EAL domain-containing protein [Mycobacteriales bacterium]|nr:EAL domain-containing protein [Mycobacteriales bacterium]
MGALAASSSQDPAAVRADLGAEWRALRTLVDHVPAMIAYWDRDLINVVANAAYLQWFGKSPEQVRGRHIVELLGEELYERNLPYIRGALEGKRQVFDRVLVDTNGETRYTQAEYVPDIGADGQVRGFCAQVTDVTDRTKAHQELDAALAFRDAVLSTSPDVISIFDLESNQTVWASRSLPAVLGYDIGQLREFQARGLETILDPESAARFAASMVAVRHVEDGGFVEGVARIRHADGSWRVISRRSTPFRRSADGQVIQVLNATRDVTTETEQREELRRAVAFQDAVIATAPDLIVVIEVDSGRLSWTSRPLAQLLGWSNDEVAEMGDRPLESLAHWDDVEELRAVQQAIRLAPDATPVHLRYRSLTAYRGWRWLQLAMTPFERSADSEVTSIVAAARDVTELVEAEEQLAHAALHDPLTGLPNRRLIVDRLEMAIAGLPRSGAVGILFIDLDGFKRINDAHGHAAGDAVLKATAERLCGAVRPADTVGRMGGDEFVVIAPALPDEDAHAVASQLADRIRKDVAEPVAWEGQEHRVTASIGLVLAGADSDAQSLLRDADSAMYLAKKRGKDTIAGYEPALHTEAMQRAATEQAIRRALATSSVEVLFQPIIRLSDRRVESVEALLRIRDERGDFLDTQHVVDVAEATGLITELGPAVLRIAAEKALRWEGAPRVAVNLSAREIGGAEFYDRVRSVIDDVGLPPSRLVLELTETALLEAAYATMQDLDQLREDGVGIAIDDFGTGYASLRYLTALPVTGIKIDRSFTTGLGHDHVDESIVAACLQLTRDLDIECVVEGVESRQQLERLSAHPHVYVQGYLIGRPEPAAAA